MVNPISFDPTRAAINGFLPISIWRKMFSSMTMASSTTKPTDRIKAIMDKLSRLYFSRYMTEKVPMMENGSARLGMMVAETLRRNTKMTAITRPSVINIVNCTSL